MRIFKGMLAVGVLVLDIDTEARLIKVLKLLILFCAKRLTACKNVYTLDGVSLALCVITVEKIYSGKK